MTENSFSRRFVITALVIFGVLILYTMRFFLDGFLGAVTLYVLSKPYMQKLMDKGWKKGRAAMIILLVSIVVVMIPVFLLIYLIVPKISLLFSSGSLTMEALQKADLRIYELTGFNFITPENIAKLQSSGAEFIANFLGQSVNIITDIALLFLFLYYMLIHIGRNERFLNRIIPLPLDKVTGFAHELEIQTRSNALGIPLLATVQGIFACLGYWIFQLPDPFFWGMITGLFSILPFVGSAFIWIPAGIFLLSNEMIWQGAGVLLYGAIVISSVDNLFRLTFQKIFADIHPLITIIGIIVGVQLFGMPGLIFGPLMISYFILFFKILQESKTIDSDN